MAYNNGYFASNEPIFEFYISGGVFVDWTGLLSDLDVTVLKYFSNIVIKVIKEWMNWEQLRYGAYKQIVYGE